MSSIHELLEQARNTLATDSAARDAEILLCHTLACERSYLYTWPEKNLDTATEKNFLNLINARATGTPVAYLTGVREFFSLPFQVSTDTLIPRPETELLVSYILDTFNNDTLDVLDLGTGSGAIAIALAQARAHWTMTACDISSACIKIAARNAVLNNVQHLELLQSDWFENLDGRRFDLIVSNPPYIAAQDPHLSQGDLRFEPITALVSGEDGMTAIRHLCQHTAQALKPGGWFFTEHGYDQKSAVLDCFKQQGFSKIVQLDDLAGQPRLSGGQISS